MLSSVASTTTSNAPEPTPGDARTARVLARSMFKDLENYGASEDAILAVAGELIALVSEKLDARD